MAKNTQIKIMESISQINHWLMALLIMILLAIGLYSHVLPRGPERAELQVLHKIFEVIHTLTAKYVILPLLILHVLADLKRTFVDRDGTLRRMFGT